MTGQSSQFPPEIISLLHSAQRVAVLTGAGISAESGIPTFRDAMTGLWAKYDPQELATADAFLRHPRLVWEWYAWRRELVSMVMPNPGHLALAELEQMIPSFTLMTQNVDGLHQCAGSRNVIELHGNLRRVKCFKEGTAVPLPVNGPSEEIPPHCPRCGAYLRPDVVWFGETLPQENLAAAWQAARRSQVFFSIGTSGLVQPAASLPFAALDAGAVVVEINAERTPLTEQATYSLPGQSGQILPSLVEAAFGRPD
jgi:NAD-dependent deacetylase